MRDAARLPGDFDLLPTNQPSKPLQLAASLSSATAAGLWPISENFADGGEAAMIPLNFGNLGMMEVDDGSSGIRKNFDAAAHFKLVGILANSATRAGRRQLCPAGGIQRSLR